MLALSEANRPQSGIDLLFFDHYKDEFDSISARHEALADRISKYATDQDHSTAREREDSDLLHDVRDLRDRLYTFVACGVYSSATTDADRFEILRTLGFSVSHVSRVIDISPLIGASVMAMITLSVFTGYTVELFRDGFKLNALDPGWKRALPIPTMPFEIYAWSWSTAAFYLTTIFAALLVRNTRIARRQWFDLNNLERERPIPRYVTPTFVGAAVGILTLSGIAIVGGPGMKGSFGELAKAAANALPWSPLALFMALIALVLSDNQLVFGGNIWRKIAGYAVLSAVLMGGVGYLNSHLIIWTGIDEYAARTGQPVPEIVSKAGTYLSPFIAFQISLIVFVLCAIIQIYEYYAMKARSFSGKAVEIIAKQEAIFSLHFDPAGTAALLPALKNAGTTEKICDGRWQYFPEGTAMKWNRTSGSNFTAGDFGLISGVGGSLIYEGYADGFYGDPELIAQVRVGN